MSTQLNSVGGPFWSKMFKVSGAVLAAIAAVIAIAKDLPAIGESSDYTVEIVSEGVLLSGVEVVLLDGSNWTQVTSKTGVIAIPADREGKLISIRHPKSRRVLSSRVLSSLMVIQIEVELLSGEKEGLVP